jgi:hypothetical protein
MGCTGPNEEEPNEEGGEEEEEFFCFKSRICLKTPRPLRFFYNC